MAGPQPDGIDTPVVRQVHPCSDIQCQHRKLQCACGDSPGGLGDSRSSSRSCPGHLPGIDAHTGSSWPVMTCTT
eukprot:scaffold870_cov393-Prasinococcus_capsulatus_cf.AAC.15